MKKKALLIFGVLVVIAISFYFLVFANYVSPEEFKASIIKDFKENEGLFENVRSFAAKKYYQNYLNISLWDEKITYYASEDSVIEADGLKGDIEYLMSV